MPSTVCMPGKFAALCNKLNEAQRRAVHDIGLGRLLSVPSMSIRRILLESLADCYSDRDRSFTIRGHVVSISTWDVHCILGLLDRGEKITISKKTADPNLFVLYKGEGESSITFKHLERRINSGAADEHFIRMFVLYAIGTLLAPCSKEHVSSHYLEVVAEISKIKDYNWAEFTLEYLLTNLENFKINKRSGLVGNLALLQVWYFEHFQADGDSFDYALHEHPLIKNWDEKQCEKRVLFDGINKIGAGKVVMHLQVNDFDTRFNDDPIVDGIIDESPKEMSNGYSEDEKKWTDLDGSHNDAKCDIGHETDNQDSGQLSNLNARLKVVEEQASLVPQLYAIVQGIARIVGYDHGLSPSETDGKSGNPSLHDQLSLIPIIVDKLDDVIAQLSGKKRPMANEGRFCSSLKTKKLRKSYCKGDMGELISPSKKNSDLFTSTVVDTFQCMNLGKAHSKPTSNVKRPFSSQTSKLNRSYNRAGATKEDVEVASPTLAKKIKNTKNVEIPSPTLVEKAKSISSPTTVDEVKSIEMFSSESLLEKKVKTREEDEVSSPTLVEKVKSRTNRKPSKICSSLYLGVNGKRKFGSDNNHIDDITRGLDLSDLDVAAIKFVLQELALDILKRFLFVWVQLHNIHNLMFSEASIL